MGTWALVCFPLFPCCHPFSHWLAGQEFDICMYTTVRTKAEEEGDCLLLWKKENLTLKPSPANPLRLAVYFRFFFSLPLRFSARQLLLFLNKIPRIVRGHLDQFLVGWGGYDADGGWCRGCRRCEGAS
ncbi:hypothetical protein B0H66DRAFT_47228 [Apodospora peruviana]|uniref:Secreted protein n=1 Tax=Apodospora peruviana TaxID=516989 RepID=A0AAE0IRV7_9PEZI|nr:hypothetical protein B0H66DRAFT_47228 [Apodospora peruviana]